MQPTFRVNKTDNVRITQQSGAFVQPLSQWTNNAYYIFWARVCVWVALIIQHATRVRHIVICGLSGCTVFFHIISWTVMCRKQKLMNIKCVFWFSLQLLSETFLILRRNERDVIKIYIYWVSFKVALFLSDFNETLIFSTNCRQMLKYQTSLKIRLLGA